MPGASVSRGSILVIADDASVRTMVAVVLRSAGYDVTLATQGREALTRIAEAVPDLVVSSITLEDMDGFRLLSRLRANPATRAVPVILLSDEDAPEDLVTGLLLGADDGLRLPLNVAELLARVRVKMERPPVPKEQLARNRQSGLLTESIFAQPTERELARAERTGRPGCLAFLEFQEWPQLRERLGDRSQGEIARQVAMMMNADSQPTDVFGHDAEGRFALLMPETDLVTARRRLATVAHRAVEQRFVAGGESLRLTPAIGFATFAAGISPEELRGQAYRALDYAVTHLDLQPERYDRTKHYPALSTPSYWATAWERLRLPVQMVLVQFIAFVLPFLVYVALHRFGIDIAPTTYLVIVLFLAISAYFMGVESFLAFRATDAPTEPATLYPAASAIIAAYLPNEAATVVETIEAFLRVEYLGQLQIVLAYNTPQDLPVEAVLHDIARRHPRFLPLRVEGSTSKAQNINAALGHVRGEFVGVFDADHHPNPDSFARAWRWLSHGYDVAQGHCAIRNGDESWVTRLVAVEFEAIYAVSHPGRARMHGFGIFGGSNGYWKTDVLRRIRMHRSMLTEDIDAALRAVEAGYRIVSDPRLISRELAPVKAEALMHQRLRWAQGWFQVSLKHTRRLMRSPHLSVRQKLGVLHLLPWREVYPLLSFQIFPILAFEAWRYGGLTHIAWFVPVLVFTTFFICSTGPLQALVALLLSAPEIRQHRRWFLSYLVISFFVYTPFKNLLSVVAQIKELMRERQWKVTPRTSTRISPAADI